jgi:hypothetical protein
MAEAVAKPWFQYSAAGIIAAVERLKIENPHDLFLLLTRAAASGEWNIFLPAFEKVSRVKGIKLLLPAPDGFAMRYAYDSAGLPTAYWPVFIGVLEVARVLAEEGSVKAGKDLRDRTLARVFALPTVRDLPIAAELARNLAV